MRDFTESINKIFADINDSRGICVSYPIKEILFLFTLGMISGCTDYEDICEWGVLRLDELKKYMDFINSIPHARTLARVISNIKSEEINNILKSFVNLAGKDQKHIALDGKHLGNGLYSVSAFEANNCLTIGQSKPYSQGHELQGIKSLLCSLEIKNSVISIDAIGCNKSIFELIKKNQADAIIAIKSNNKYLYSQIKNLFEQKGENLKTEDYSNVNKGHGRVEERNIRVLQNLELIPEVNLWPAIKSVIEVTSMRHIKGKSSIEKRYYVATKSFSGEECAGYIRNHWAIENNLHWVLDVNMKEDSKRHLVRNAIYNTGVIRRFVLNIIKTLKPPNKSMISFQRKIGRDPTTMHQIIKDAFVTLS